MALLARRKASLESVCQAVEKEGGVVSRLVVHRCLSLTSLRSQAKPFACDASDKQSILDAFAAIKNEFPDHEVKVSRAVYAEQFGFIADSQFRPPCSTPTTPSS